MSSVVAAPHAALLTAATQGDNVALATLVRAYHARVYRFGVRVCRDGFDAEDAVQEAFTKLTTRPDVVAHPSALSWLMSVVRNACRRMLRPVRREQQQLGERIDDLDVVAAEELNPAQVLERQQIVDAVAAGIASLEPPYREVLLLRDVEGLSGAATCALLGLAPAAMKTRLHRARIALRASIALSHAAGDTLAPLA